jgi:glycosyltransferase involved in cell wall biosynthesis
VRSLLACDPPPDEIVLIDQTPEHDLETTALLESWNANEAIRWIRRSPPSITQAMNAGLLVATHPVVLYLDDDIVPHTALIGEHRAAHLTTDATAVVGQVLQPGQSPTDAEFSHQQSGLHSCLDFPFNSSRPAWVDNVMAGNLSVRRDAAIAVGGFDENFVGSAYRFETEFARRFVRSGRRIRFHPAASIRHLRAARGGTRSTGSHLTSASPKHGVGDHYFALLNAAPLAAGLYMARRAIREVCTRFHLGHPWYIPVKFVGELRAAVMALQLYRGGQKLLAPRSIDPPPETDLP